MTPDLTDITVTVLTVTLITETLRQGSNSVVTKSVIKSVYFLSSFFKQVSHVMKIEGRTDT